MFLQIGLFSLSALPDNGAAHSRTKFAATRRKRLKCRAGGQQTSGTKGPQYSCNSWREARVNHYVEYDIRFQRGLQTQEIFDEQHQR
ncbi:hypothetical protein [Pseudomonas syringae]|uniref:Uncharacterized protein n=2 Tax=Pseudomonas syringae group TaxID=136849 RepID=A0A9Q4A4V4_PSESX|nr:hypothetical protein [Pseudomonas syringae]KTB56808.1 hypothetical protein AO067_17035 [Pseudomonas viridiflava ICMP 13104]KTB86252.1 hypothetical protein AO070_08955 [Pseudomonas syringae pv. syringae PD2766]MCF5468334.1 hypothetical protein [Pseudomonas syringae]MCF5472888.1 hypothetical protein [Pseudomonas syringae]MCF5482903.1 hypothetical protein [Pseudomonas syringae]